MTAIRTVTARKADPEDDYDDRPLVLPQDSRLTLGTVSTPVIQTCSVPTKDPLAFNVAHSDSSYAKGFRNHRTFLN